MGPSPRPLGVQDGDGDAQVGPSDRPRGRGPWEGGCRVMWALRKLLRTGWGRTLLSSRGLAVGGEVGIQSRGLSVMRGAELASALPERADGAAGAEEGRWALGHPVLAPAPLPVCL